MDDVSNWAVIDNTGLVVNVILWDGQGDLGLSEYTFVKLPYDSPVGPGYTTPDNGVTFVAPPPLEQPQP